MIDRVIFANSRDDLVAATHALDRVLLWNHYVVPQWSYGKVRSARWDRFGRPDPLPKYGASHFQRCGGGTPTRRRKREAASGRRRRRRKACTVAMTRRRMLHACRRRHASGRLRLARCQRRRIECARSVGIRRPRLSGRFHALPLRQSEAPKGGVFSQIGPNRQFNQNFLTFNSLNSYILRGDAAQGMELTFATLMARSGDEPDAMYGLAAAKVQRSTDGVSYRFYIRPEAKFYDGTRLTARRCCVLAEYPQGKRPSADHPVAARLCRRQGRRRCQRRRHFHAEPGARRAALGRRPADLLSRLLFDEALRRIHTRNPARLRRLQSRPL